MIPIFITDVRKASYKKSQESEVLQLFFELQTSEKLMLPQKFFVFHHRYNPLGTTSK